MSLSKVMNNFFDNLDMEENDNFDIVKNKCYSIKKSIDHKKYFLRFSKNFN